MNKESNQINKLQWKVTTGALWWYDRIIFLHLNLIFLQLRDEHDCDSLVSSAYVPTTGGILVPSSVSVSGGGRRRTKGATAMVLVEHSGSLCA